MYALLTRAPVSNRINPILPCDLHVLSLPLAFILSQDQTLHRCARKQCAIQEVISTGKL